MKKSDKNVWFTNGTEFIYSQYNNFIQYVIRGIICTTYGWRRATEEEIKIAEKLQTNEQSIVKKIIKHS